MTNNIVSPSGAANRTIVLAGSNKAYLISRILLIVLALIFALSSVLKALDPHFFVTEITYYKIMVIGNHPNIIKILAMILIGVEAALAVALLLRVRLCRIVLPGVFLLLLSFTTLLLWTRITRGSFSCGCFGKYLTTGPSVSVMKNIVMMVFAVTAWFIERKRDAEARLSEINIQREPVAFLRYVPNLGRRGFLAISICFLMAGLMMTVSVNRYYGWKIELYKKEEIRNARAESMAVDLSRFFENSENGTNVNMLKNEWFVAVLKDSSKEYPAEVKMLNKWNNDSAIPNIVVLIIGNNDAYNYFKEELKPPVPIRLVPASVFGDFSSVDNVTLQLYYLVDGYVRYWFDADLSLNKNAEKDILDTTAKIRKKLEK